MNKLKLRTKSSMSKGRKNHEKEKEDDFSKKITRFSRASPL
jgi:hypothetical protein